MIEQDLVEASGSLSQPFVRTAESVGNKIVTNIVMLGYLNGYLDLIPPELLEAAVLANVPAGTEDLNRQAVRAGRQLYTSGGGEQ